MARMRTAASVVDYYHYDDDWWWRLMMMMMMIDDDGRWWKTFNLLGEIWQEATRQLEVRNSWRYNPARRDVPPTSCFFVLKGTEHKKVLKTRKWAKNFCLWTRPKYQHQCQQHPAGWWLFLILLIPLILSQEHDPWWFMVHPHRIIILLQITTAFILCNLAHLISISYDDHQQHPGISSINHITNHTWEPGSSKQPGALQVPRMHSTTSTADQEEARSNWVPIILLLGQ